MKQVLVWSARHLFILAVGFYALMHSTWTLATLFLGMEPPQLTLAWFAWVIPAFVFAIAIDVGQIVTSVELRNGERTRFKYATFAVLAIATYYLQWFYLASHMPLVPLAEGVSKIYVPASISMRDLALWIVPGLLPVSTFLYTFSFAKVKRPIPVKQPARSELRVEMPSAPVEPLDPSHLIPGRSTETPGETAARLFTEQPELYSVPLSELERRYPDVSRSTWNRVKQRRGKD